MAPEASAQREQQEQSIKARKHELFVDESVETAPRKAFREYLKETPAAPLSKNVKLILWGSSAPVVFLFLAAMLTSAKSAPPKPPEEPLHSLVPIHRTPPPSHVARHSDGPRPSGPSADKPSGVKPGGGSPAGSKPEPAKAKPKKKPKKKPNKKAQAKKPEEAAKPADGDAKKDSDRSPDDQGQAKDPKADSDKGKDKAGASKKSTSKTPAPPRSTGPSFFKKKKAPVYQYPKDGPEKKGESNNSSDNPLPGIIP